MNDQELKHQGDDLLRSENLTISEVARKFGLHRKTVIKMVSEGAFPHAFSIKRGRTVRWLIPAADLAGFTPRPKGRPRRAAAPTARILDSRAAYARRLIRISHGDGGLEIAAMINLQKEGATIQQIARQFRLAEKIVGDLLEHAARQSPPRPSAAAVKKELKRVPKKILIKLYVTEQLPTAKILEQLRINIAALYINLRHYGIPLRDERHRRQAGEREDALRRMLIEESLSPEEIAARMQLTAAYVKRKINELKLRK